AKAALAYPLPDPRGDQAAGARVGARVHGGERAVVQALAPQLDEHCPELAVARGHLQAGADERAQAAPGPPGASRLGGDAAIEISAHAQRGGGEDGLLVLEVVV